MMCTLTWRQFSANSKAT